MAKLKQMLEEATTEDPIDRSGDVIGGGNAPFNTESGTAADASGRFKEIFSHGVHELAEAGRVSTNVRRRKTRHQRGTHGVAPVDAF